METSAEAREMEGNYFVMYKRDLSGEKLCSNFDKSRMMYDGLKTFESSNSALEFAFSRMGELPLLVKSGYVPSGDERLKDPARPYLLAAYFPRKYHHYSYDGSSDAVPTHEVLRCSESELEATIEMLAKETPDKIFMGLELSLFGGGEIGR